MDGGGGGAAIVPRWRVRAGINGRRDGDRLARTTYIQRINTVGGLAPAGTCDPAVAKDTPVPYEADYVFWKATGGG